MDNLDHSYLENKEIEEAYYVKMMRKIEAKEMFKTRR